MRPPGSPSQLERRRRRAIQLRKRGLTTLAVAEQLGCSHSSVVRWGQAYERAGPKGLAPKPTPGRPPKLVPRQKQRLVRLLLQGPLTAGYRTDLWTTPRVADVIRRRLGVSYHPNSIWGLLRGLGWSCQKPERRALQRNEPAIAHWKRYVWPHIKKALPGLAWVEV